MRVTENEQLVDRGNVWETAKKGWKLYEGANKVSEGGYIYPQL